MMFAYVIASISYWGFTSFFTILMEHSDIFISNVKHEYMFLYII